MAMKVQEWNIVGLHENSTCWSILTIHWQAPLRIVEKIISGFQELAWKPGNLVWNIKSMKNKGEGKMLINHKGYNLNHRLFKRTYVCATWTPDLALPWITHNVDSKSQLVSKIILGYSYQDGPASKQHRFNQCRKWHVFIILCQPTAYFPATKILVDCPPASLLTALSWK